MDRNLSGPKGIFTTTMQEYGNAFAASTYPLWHANNVGRENLRRGVKPPLSGMMGGMTNRYNGCCEDIDWQIECDWVGLMCPAMPQTAMALHDSVGHLMCYANGLYGGYFVGACDALAFRYSDIHTVVKEALKCVPSQSQYYEIINEVIKFHDTKPDSSYQACWRYINGKYQSTTRFCGNINPKCGVGCWNIAASLNGAFIAIGLLYGDGDILKSIEYACRCGQDSDCNPSNAGAIVGALLGYNKLPQQWKTSIEQYPTKIYASSTYSYPKLIESSLARAKKAIQQKGGTESNGVWTINIEEPTPPTIYEQYERDPVANTVSVRSGFRQGTTVHSAATKLSNDAANRSFDVRGRPVRAHEIRSMGVLVVRSQGAYSRMVTAGK